MTIDYRNGVFIGEICVYIPSLFVAVYLAMKHGFGRNSGWLYLILFCLARIIGPCMQLATISQPDNTSLYIGSAILNGVGISPLELAALGLLGRLLDNIHKTYNTFLTTRMLQFVQLVLLVGVILGIVGGIDAGNAFSTNGGHFHPGTLSKVGSILLIVSCVGIVVFTAIISIFVSRAEAGEKRLFLAVAISLPFLLVRLASSGLSTFSTDPKFNLLVGNTTMFLCIALIEELIIVIVFEFMGLTLRKEVKEEYVEAERRIDSASSSHPMQPKQNSAGNMALNIAKKTIIGRIVMSVVGSHGETDVEMQAPRH